MKIIFILFTIFLNSTVLAFSFSSIFGGGGSSSKHKKSQSVNFDDAKNDFANYCIKTPESYGFQIHCIQTSIPNVFKFNASETLRCKEHVNGVNNVFPDPVDLPQAFIKQMNLCPDGKIFGPNLLHTTLVAESDSNTGVQKNQTETYYDVVCGGNQTYSNAMYQTMQANYNANIADKLNKCEKGEDVNTYSSRYILIFKIFVGLALISFILRFYFKYQTQVNQFFAKLKRK